MRTVLEFKKMKEAGEKITMLTAYDYTTARIFNEANIDCLLVGDSLAMVMHGFPSTVHATTELIALHTAAVSRGAPDKFIVADMPFLSVRKGLNVAMDAVDVLMKAGASAVKIEGLKGHEDIIAHVIESGVPVMGHLGLTPQSIHAFGGNKVQGKEEKKAESIFEDALKLQELGCFCLVLECVPEKLATKISRELTIPTIGIGAGKETDGQVLVWQDMFGMTDIRPKFLKHYMDGKTLFHSTINNYSVEVKNGAYPEKEHSYQ